jgi:valyl-tRNA synthetase
MESIVYDQQAIEMKWQKLWEEMKIYHFNFSSNKPPYSIDVPPRYASGPLHAGHAVHYTHIDFTARYKRMKGFEVFFPLCFDVNGIPIEERVERQLNITRKDIDRHEFTRLCSEFANKNIKTMIDQFRILGESMDPTIYYQTDAEYYRRITQISFIELFNKNLIYRGKFPVNWCPRCMTAMADAEVVYKDNTTKLNMIKFYFKEDQPHQILTYQGIGKDEKGAYIEIATTRPEMLPSCQIVAIHPTDDRAAWLEGKIVLVPIFDKEVKIVQDDVVDPDFGTGIVMICTIGDKEDLNWVFKYKLPLEMSIDEEGKMTEICGPYQGMRIKDAKEAVIQDMKKQNLLIAQKTLDQNVGVCWRCKTPIEFINAKQWFLKTTDFKKMVLKSSNNMHWYPEFMKIRLEEWVNSLEWDWVISRQRYFATPIPIWECEACGEVVLARIKDCYIDPTIDSPPVQACPSCNGNLIGSDDVFDTWMDSSISPLFNTFWHRDDEKFEKLYPMSVRPQAHDIIRTWAFYTILRCNLLTDNKPFENVMMGGFILSEDGTPMHASLGNVIDPLHIIDKYGTDAFRCYAASCSLGEDNAFREKDVIRGKKLLRKIWNVEQFIKQHIASETYIERPSLTLLDSWILTKYSMMVEKVTEQMDVFDYSQAMKQIEYFLWHEFADHYIEMVKAYIYNEKNVESYQYTLYTIGLGLLKLFSPFFPHITEELYQMIYKDIEGVNSIHISNWPDAICINKQDFETGESVKNYIAQVRSFKSKQGIPLNAPLLSMATYADESVIIQLETQRFLITETLKIPKDHQFIVGKPNIDEVIAEITPNFAKIGPELKNESKALVSYLKSNQEALISLMKDQQDITWKDIPLDLSVNKNESLIESNYIIIKKELQVKGYEQQKIASFDGFYLLVASEVIS